MHPRSSDLSHSCLHFRHCFVYNDTSTTEIYTLSLHDALPIYPSSVMGASKRISELLIQTLPFSTRYTAVRFGNVLGSRSEEHTSELQSPCNLVCRLLLEKKKKKS